MFTSTRPSSQTYQVATVFAAPSGVTEPMTDGFGFASTLLEQVAGDGWLGHGRPRSYPVRTADRRRRAATARAVARLISTVSATSGA